MLNPEKKMQVQAIKLCDEMHTTKSENSLKEMDIVSHKLTGSQHSSLMTINKKYHHNDPNLNFKATPNPVLLALEAAISGTADSIALDTIGIAILFGISRLLLKFNDPKIKCLGNQVKYYAILASRKTKIG